MTGGDEEATIELTRHVDAPIEAVFAALTDAAGLDAWWGPEGFGVPSATLDPRPGGAIRIVMRAPDGTESTNDGSYREVVPPSRLAMDMTAYRGDGTPLLTADITIDLTEEDGGTSIRVRATGRALEPDARPMLAGMREGWNQTLDRLERLLAEARGSTLKMRHDTA